MGKHTDQHWDTPLLFSYKLVLIVMSKYISRIFLALGENAEEKDHVMEKMTERVRQGNKNLTHRNLQMPIIYVIRMASCETWMGKSRMKM